MCVCEQVRYLVGRGASHACGPVTDSVPLAAFTREVRQAGGAHRSSSGGRPAPLLVISGGRRPRAAGPGTRGGRRGREANARRRNHVREPSPRGLSF